jgi:hypothetical protein
MSRPGTEPGPPRWEASNLAKSYLNSVLIAIRNIYILFRYTAGKFRWRRNSTENSGPHAKNFFCSMYEMSQRHPVWVAENHVKPCNSAMRTRFLLYYIVTTGHLPAACTFGQSFTIL